MQNSYQVNSPSVAIDESSERTGLVAKLRQLRKNIFSQQSLKTVAGSSMVLTLVIAAIVLLAFPVRDGFLLVLGLVMLGLLLISGLVWLYLAAVSSR